MLPKKAGSFEIFGINIDKLDYDSFIELIKKNNNENGRLTIAYANADTLNKSYNDDALRSIYNSFDIIHPDGIGVFLAAKFLYGKDGLDKRLTGSDFYSILVNESVKNNWSYFFFGHDKDILKSIKKAHPDLNIAGFHEGYRYDNEKVITAINEVKPDILIIGLSCPLQEKWIYENKDKIQFKVILAVGDGIKIFANKKYRGPVFLRKMGLEWLVRYLNNPISNFRKYIIGNPLFVQRIINKKVKVKLK